VKVLKGLWILILAVSFVTVAQAATSGESTATLETSNRMNKKIGVSVGIVGDPYPSIFGVNGSYNLTDFVRASLGYGEVEIFGNSLKTIGLGATAFVPGWSLTPTFGMHYSNITAEGDGELEIQGYKGSGNLAYTSLGFDWQAHNGFNISSGYNIPITGRGDGNVYASAGWFFSFLN
jgi:hypothetical protein